MFCKQCRNTKLRREFPSVTLTDECNHAPLHCLRCVIHSVKNVNKCSQCSKNVTTDNLRYIEFVETLERLFPETPHLLTETTDAASEDANPTISVFKLGGESTVFEYQPGMTVKHLKVLVKERLGTLPEKQRLLYKDQELKSYADSKLTTLQDYNIEPFSTLHLIVLLYAIPDSFDHVIFDLFWGYPTKGRDYLDASVLIYSGNQLQERADYCRTWLFSGAIYHSGDVMDDAKRLGHHTINVKLKSLPPNIDKLFFYPECMEFTKHLQIQKSQSALLRCQRTHQTALQRPDAERSLLPGHYHVQFVKD